MNTSTTGELIKLKGKDILLLLLYFPGKNNNIADGMVGATRLMKAMFLFDKEIKKEFLADIEQFPEFMAWRFGPWSDQIPDDIEFFKGIGFVSSQPTKQDGELNIAEEEELDRWEEETFDVSSSELEDFHEPQKFYLTQSGIRYVESNLIPKLSKNQAKTLSEFKKKIASLSLFSILTYVYKKYNKGKEDFIKNSEIKDEIIKE